MCVVGGDGFGNGALGVFAGVELVVEIELVLQDAIHPLGIAIFIAVILFGHADRQPATVEQAHLLVAAVLAATVRMMDGPAVGGQLRDGALQGLTRLGGRIGVTRVPTHDAA